MVFILFPKLCLDLVIHELYDNENFDTDDLQSTFFERNYKMMTLKLAK